MEKLELKHLAPYLPYGLKYWAKEYKGLGIFDADRNESFDNEMKSISIEAIIRHQDIYKPILRPLSDLTKEIITDQRREFGDSIFQQSYYDNISELINSIHNEEIPLALFNLLIEFHFDVFGLIEKGLAIDINQLPK